MATPAPALSPRTRWTPAAWIVATVILVLPAIAMSVGAEGVHWTASDFVVAGVLLYGTCALYDVARRMSPDRWYRAGAGVAVTTGLLLVWVNLAVGIIDSENDAANLVFAGVLLVAAIGALLVRLRARGMATVLLVTAIAQACAAVFAGFAGHDGKGLPAAGLFVPMWLASAWLFHRAAIRTQRTTSM